MRFAAIAAIVVCAASATLPSLARAEKADRDKPVNLEADRVTMDDKRKVSVFEGNVQMTEGTLLIRTDRLVVTQDADGMQKAVAYGGPGGMARFRQKREGKDEWVDGEAERIEYDDRTQKSEFFGRAYVKSGLDELHGNYIAYDGKTENYVVNSGAAAGVAAAGRDTRVRAVIQPKNKDKDASAPGTKTPDAAPLKSASDVAPPSKE